ncbi:hypothetical protein [Pectobacterium phage Mimer]|nr:inhibiting host DNA replication and capsid packaging protein [Pectobacterium phage Mimer]
MAFGLTVIRFPLLCVTLRTHLRAVVGSGLLTKMVNRCKLSPTLLSDTMYPNTCVRILIHFLLIMLIVMRLQNGIIK